MRPGVALRSAPTPWNRTRLLRGEEQLADTMLQDLLACAEPLLNHFYQLLDKRDVLSQCKLGAYLELAGGAVGVRSRMDQQIHVIVLGHACCRIEG